MSDDHYRAFGVVDTVRADRVDRFPDEFPMTMTADDEQPGVARRVHEDMAWPAGGSPDWLRGSAGRDRASPR